MSAAAAAVAGRAQPGGVRTRRQGRAASQSSRGVIELPPDCSEGREARGGAVGTPTGAVVPAGRRVGRPRGSGEEGGGGGTALNGAVALSDVSDWQAAQSRGGRGRAGRGNPRQPVVIDLDDSSDERELEGSERERLLSFSLSLFLYLSTQIFCNISKNMLPLQERE